MEVSGLYIYPIKSMAGVSLAESEVELRGLKYDRRYVLVDEAGVFVSQRKLPEMCLFKVELNASGFVVFDKTSNDKIQLPFELKNGLKTKVKIWDDTVNCIVASDLINRWFSAKLGMNLRLCYQPDSEIRKIDEKYKISENDQTSMSDGYPILILSEESVAEIDKRCPDDIAILRFRPNIIVKGYEPFEEDRLASFAIGDAKFEAVKKCARCLVVNIDYTNGKSGKEPLRTLSGFRLFNSKIQVGTNVIVSKTGKIVLKNKIYYSVI